MAKHSTNKTTKLMVCMNHPPKSSSSPATFHNQVVPVSSIHNEARGRLVKVGASEDHANHQDPTSPNISCLGQIRMHELKKEKTEKKKDQEHVDAKDKKQSSIRVLIWRFLRCGLGFKTARKSGLRCDGSSRDDTGEEERIEPILVLQPRTEINLWLRRKAASPPLLQV